MGLFSFLGKNKDQEILQEDVAESNWYQDRYESVLIQRNLIFLFALGCIVSTFVAIFFIGKVTLSKSIEPMVVEVEESTGITNIVNPLEDRKWTQSRALNEYFLVRYLRARETYDIATYLQNYNLVVRLLSSANIYNQFRQDINNPDISQVAKYGASNNTVLKIRSIQFLQDSANGKNVQIRFAVIEQQGSKRVYNKIASIVFNYVQLNLSVDERYINPLGFQIDSYSVSGERDV